ncbi:tubulin-specific chaperone C-like [Styela clava]
MDAISSETNGSKDTIMKKKELKTAMLEKREEERVDSIQQKRNQDTESKAKMETYDYFISHFKDECDAVQTELDRTDINKSDRIQIASYLENLSESYEKVLKFVNNSTMFLRPYQLEQAQKTLNQVQTDVSKKKLELIPKKKFTFKSKKKNEVSVKESDKNPVKKVDDKKFNFSASECGISDKYDATIAMKPDEINQRDVSLTKLENCRLELSGYPGTVHLNNIKKCVILCGPVSGSVFVDNCTDTKIITGCQQLRVHNTTDTDFYIHVTSRAIIEDTSRVRFAPFNWTYENLQDDFGKSGLNKDLNNWSKVDDFNWLAADIPSPNWSLLPESERKQQW